MMLFDRLLYTSTSGTAGSVVVLRLQVSRELALFLSGELLLPLETSERDLWVLTLDTASIASTCTFTC